MKRAILFFVLGFVVAFYVMMNGSGSSSHPMSQSQEERVSHVVNALSEFSSDVKTWLSGFKNHENPKEESTMSTSLTVDYDAALKIVSEMIEDIGSLLTDDQKAALEQGVNQLYRQNLLKEYGDSTENPIYRE
ncbi:hypothetical protein PNU83_00980 [Turicibacter sanguinis]|uniref:hypothetical protein n=1 Tax=Turicibacter sanguinis TaxID=154288 RepID=UPI0018A9B626|nr:hypothetical protein [Turicibacter sanguinis]MDB8562668.1 hypothetical protein [Turicibacter sanguinis]